MSLVLVNNLTEAEIEALETAATGHQCCGGEQKCLHGVQCCRCCECPECKVTRCAKWDCYRRRAHANTRVCDEHADYDPNDAHRPIHLPKDMTMTQYASALWTLRFVKGMNDMGIIGYTS
jgi:hypothetical protein